ncbi:tubulin epsilon and delta complex protein 2 [Rhinoderma darwinii]|uniref:tubulin epsilon and delta complex protein 2 n=1 Tax=Rhinoderma darwinii TaxID=43563 RepID=UPI003F670172
MMLSSTCSQRLVSLLNQTLLSCKEEEKQLEEQLRQWRKLLDNRDPENCEPLKQDDVANEPPKIQPSPEDLEEVALLNKALEKALRVRGTSRTDSPVNKALPCPSSCPVTKEKPIKALNKLTQKGTKLAIYQLNPPYKTILDRRKVPRPVHGASGNKSTGLTSLAPPALKKMNSSEGGGQLEAKASTIRPCSALSKPVFPPPTLSYPISQPQKPSTLKEKRSTLKLPVTYQQAYTKSNKLWEKFYAIQDHLPASRPSFIQKLQTTFAPETPKLSLFEIEEESTRLLREVRSWQQNVDSVHNWQRSGPARWQNYRSLLLLEALQEEVAKFQSELQNLQLVAEEYRNWAENHSINASCSESVGCPSMYSRSPPVLIYNHPDELRELTRSRLRVVELQQKIHLHEVFGEELLAEAESWSQAAPTSCLLLRALYTQLCEGGNIFPVLVQDDS